MTATDERLIQGINSNRIDLVVPEYYIPDIAPQGLTRSELYFAGLTRILGCR